MPLEEKWDKLLDGYWVNVIGTYALLKELGAVDKGVDWSVKVNAKMLPRRARVAFDTLKPIAAGIAFNQLVDNYVYSLQRTLSLQDFELNKVSDREATLIINNCPILKRVRSLIKKTGLDIEPKAICEIESKINQGLAKELGLEIVTELKEDGCINNLKLWYMLIFST